MIIKNLSKSISDKEKYFLSIFSLARKPVKQGFKVELPHMSNDYYRHFVRLNNRRKTQSLEQFRLANYPESYFIISNIGNNWFTWMDNNIGEYRYFLIGRYCFFVDTSDKTLYDLTWAT